MLSRILLTSGAVLLAAPTFALDFGNGFSITGEVELEYLTDFDEDTSAAYGDVTLSWRSQGNGSLGFGFDLNPVAIAFLESGNSFSTLWGGLVMTTSLGDFTIGSPRPLFDSLSHAPVLAEARLIDLGFGQFTGSSLATARLLSGSNVDSYGVSFKGATGDLSYGAAYHVVDVSPSDVKFLELTVGYRMGATEIYGGVERTEPSSGADATTRTLLGAEYEADRWSAGLEAIHSSSGGTSATVFSLFGGYEVSENLSITALATDLSDVGAPGTLYGIGAEYRFGSGGFAQLGYAGGNGFGEDIATVSLGFRF